jgi:threonine dehydratase
LPFNIYFGIFGHMNLNLQDFLDAQARISPYLKKTPVLQSETLQKILGYKSPIYLKLESEQPTGSFKVRGAFNALLQLPPSVNKVVARSSGNFAQAVAYGASLLKKQATIVVPQNAPHNKIEGTKNLGASIIFSGNKHEEGEAIVKEFAEKEKAAILHPYNDYRTIAGQGTIALEVLETNPQMQYFFSPVGGGGLLSGCASVLKASDKKIATYSVEPFGARDFFNSFQAKKHLSLEKIDTIADGLRADSVGTINYPILMSTVDQVLTVTDEEIIEAMRLVWKLHGLIIEPSGATALAGFIKLHQEIKGEAVILVTGKNVDEDAFNKWVKT